MFLLLIRKFDQKSNFQSRMAWTRPYMSRIWAKWGRTCGLKILA